jgi:drug/metabolite transporter (DMT)-like permease
MTRRSWALFAAMCLIWGIPYLLIRVAVRDIAPGTLVFLRTGIGGLVLLPLAFTHGGFGPVPRRGCCCPTPSDTCPVRCRDC